MANASITQGNSLSSGISVIFVWIAVLIFAAANSIVLVLFNLGLEFPVEGRNAISFCNVLFIGNLIACVSQYGLYRKQWTSENLQKLTQGDWLSLLFLAVLTGALSPSVIFYALENTTVTNVVLVGRIEPFILLALSAFLLKERPDKWPTIGAAIALAGVGVAFFLESLTSGLSFGKGELLAAFGAVLAAVGIIVAKIRLKSIPLGIFAVVRTGFGSIFFFVVAIYLFGFDHFQDAFQPILWQWMFVYGALIVVGGQYFWFTGIKNVRISDVSLASSFTPIAAVGFAFLLLGERPSAPILIGGAVIVLGIVVGQFGHIISEKVAARKLTASEVLQAEGRVSFKGI
jgi:drug/metabolite transporter (DMT)-like permease